MAWNTTCSKLAMIGACSLLLAGAVAASAAVGPLAPRTRTACVSLTPEREGEVLVAVDHAGGRGQRVLEVLAIHFEESPEPTGGAAITPVAGGRGQVEATFETGNPACGDPQLHREAGSGAVEHTWVTWETPDAVCFAERFPEGWSDHAAVPLDGRTPAEVRAAIRALVLGLD